MGGVRKFRKKPVVIEAMQLTDEEGGLASEIQAWLDAHGQTCYWSPQSSTLAITTLEGVMHASVGDYVIRGVQGEFYPCKPDIFEATYEAAI